MNKTALVRREKQLGIVRKKRERDVTRDMIAEAIWYNINGLKLVSENVLTTHACPRLTTHGLTLSQKHCGARPSTQDFQSEGQCLRPSCLDERRTRVFCLQHPVPNSLLELHWIDSCLSVKWKEVWEWQRMHPCWYFRWPDQKWAFRTVSERIHGCDLPES